MSPRYSHLILDQKVKGQGHKVQKHISGDRVAGVSLRTLSSSHMAIIIIIIIT